MTTWVQLWVGLGVVLGAKAIAVAEFQNSTQVQLVWGNREETEAILS
jgi:hypothetical protein